MARKRMISPTIWEDPGFNRLSVGARLLFIGMISNADDEGYIRGDTGSLKRLIFGFDDTIAPELIKWAEEVKKIKTLHFYEIEGEKYAHFIKWHDYQKQQKDRIQASGYPKCSICLSPATQMLTEVKLGKDKISKRADKPLADPIVKELIDYFYQKTQSLKGFQPIINGGKDGALLKERLKTHAPEVLRGCIDWFLKNKVSNELSPSISTCLSAGVFNKFLANEKKHEWQYGN